MRQYFFILLGILFLLWFLAPFFTKKILNAGNILGILFSSSLLFLGIFEDILLPKMLSSVLYIPLLILVWLILIYTLIATGCMLLPLFHRPPQNGTLVVLGCKVYGSQPSLMLLERLDAAAAYLKKHPQVCCVVSGGKGDDEMISEAKCMAETLRACGISSQRIFTESDSTNTRENIAFSLSLIQKEHLPSELILVSNEFHLYRAIKIAKKQGVCAVGLPAKTAWWLFPTYYVRELLCIAYEKIRRR